MAVNLFDVNYYRQVNPDLAAGGLSTDQQLTDHFFRSGLNEGRTFSRFVDLNYYRASNPDIAAVRPTYRDLYDHLANSGVAQQRKFSPYVDLRFYNQANPDLDVFNSNYERLFEHLQSFGFNERRRFSPFFDLDFYRQTNPDLASFAQAQIFDHLRNWGLDESGRRISQFFDFNFYRSANPDLTSAGINTSRGLFNHFIDFGVLESRSASPFANINFYKYANPDLAASLTNNLEAYRSLQTTGLSQGRRISPFIDLNIYRQSNPDLYAANLSNSNLLNHLQINGLREERRVSNSFDPKIYRANNQDLTNLGGGDLLNHFAIYGINEPREASSDIFNVNFYRNNNADLNQAGVNTNALALNHYEVYGYKENRLSSNLSLSLNGSPGTSLNTASNLGFISNNRSGNLSQQQLGINNGENYYRFNTPGVTNVNITITALRGSLDLEIIFDANNNGQIDTGEVIQSSRITQANRGINLSLGAGTYFTRLVNRTNTANNYRISFNASANGGITSVDPANSADGAFTLGNFAQNQTINDFIGTSDRNDYYYFSSLYSTNGGITDSGTYIATLSRYNTGVELQLTVIEDLNNNRVIDLTDRRRTVSSINSRGQFSSAISLDGFSETTSYFFVQVSTNKPNVNTAYQLTFNRD